MLQSKPKAKIGRPPKEGGALSVSERSRTYRKRKADRDYDARAALSQDKDILLDLLRAMLVSSQSPKGLPRLIADALEEQPDAIPLARAALFKRMPPPVHQQAMVDHIRRIARQVRDEQ